MPILMNVLKEIVLPKSGQNLIKEHSAIGNQLSECGFRADNFISFSDKVLGEFFIKTEPGEEGVA